MMRATRPALEQPSTRTRSPLLSSISIAPEARQPLRRRAGRTASPASAVASIAADKFSYPLQSVFILVSVRYFVIYSVN